MVILYSCLYVYQRTPFPVSTWKQYESWTNLNWSHRVSWATGKRGAEVGLSMVCLVMVIHPTMRFLILGTEKQWKIMKKNPLLMDWCPSTMGIPEVLTNFVLQHFHVQPQNHCGDTIKVGTSMSPFIQLREGMYPPVNIQKAIENGHRNSWFSH